MPLPGRAKRRREPVYLRVVKGALVPASGQDAERLRERGYHIGDELRAELAKPRNPRFHRKVMALLQLVLENQEGLQTIDQLLTVVKIKLGRAQPFVDSATNRTYWVPESIAFDAMDEGAFQEFWRDLCTLVATDYLPDMTREQVEQAAEMMDPTH
jgi:hypothetical protein